MRLTMIRTMMLPLIVGGVMIVTQAGDSPTVWANSPGKPRCIPGLPGHGGRWHNGATDLFGSRRGNGGNANGGWAANGGSANGGNANGGWGTNGGNANGGWAGNGGNANGGNANGGTGGASRLRGPKGQALRTWRYWFGNWWPWDRSYCNLD
jgi:hypothetical protein